MLGFSIKSADFFYPRGLNLEAWGLGLKVILSKSIGLCLCMCLSSAY